ncbi:MAG TPA: hypothetical protein VGG20_16580, partial [Thermoanaerobaculia bacterium]
MRRHFNEFPRETALRIVEDNANCIEGSLVSAINDRDTFSRKAFWDYYNALITLTAEQGKGKPLRRKEAQAVYTSYSMILQFFIDHFSGCRIKKFPTKKVGLYMERLHLAGLGFFWGKAVAEEVHDPELKNRGFSFEAR